MMNNLSARISRPDVPGHGTAWLCSCEFALTAAHCVADIDNKVLYEGPFRLEFPNGQEAWCEVVEENYDFTLDAALLRVVGGEVPGEVKLLCGRLPLRDPWPMGPDAVWWEAFGFPEAKDDGMKILGTITMPDGTVKGAPAIELDCPRGVLGSLEGTSGAAVLYQNRTINKNLIVGLVRWAPPATNQLVIYASPLNLIAEKLPELQKILDENFKAAMETILAEQDKEAANNYTPYLLASRDASAVGREWSGLDDARPIPHNLPTPQTQFFGRKQKNLKDLVKLMQEPSVRLLTLTGESGTGKTRTALEIGDELRQSRSFKDGIFFIDLTTVSDQKRVGYEVASTLGIKEPHDLTFTDSLKLFLRDRQLLLILDSFEHVLPVAPFISILLESCPGLKVLVTSTGKLQLEEEVSREIKLMRLPAGAVDQLPHNRLREELPLKLFRARARDAVHNFTLTPDNTKTIALICEEAGGLPMAIELIAAQTNAKTDFSQVLRQLGEAGAESIEAKLEAAIKFAYGGLSEPEKALLRRLSVFFGTFKTEDAQAVCQSQELPAEEIKKVLQALQRKCLLHAEQAKSGDLIYRMLQKIRDFGLKQLADSGEEPITRRNHAIFFLALAKKVDMRMTVLTSTERKVWMERLERRLDDLRAILEWSLRDETNKELGLQLAGSLFWFWNLEGYFREGARWLSRALSEPRAADRPEVVAQGLYAAGGLTFLMGDYNEARRLLEESVRMWKGLGNRRRVGYALIILGMVALNQGQIDEALRHEKDCVAIFKEVDDRWGLALSLNDLGNVYNEAGNREQGQHHYKQSLTIWNELEDKWGYSLTLGNMGQLAYWKGELLAARDMQAEALAIRRAEGYEWGTAESLRRLGMVCVAQNDYAQATTLYYHSLMLHKRLGRKQLIAEGLADLAWLATKVGQPLRAAQLYGAAESTRGVDAQLSPSKEDDLSRHMAEARALAAQLSVGEEFEKSLTEGKELTLQAAVNLAAEYAAQWSKPSVV